MDNTATAHLAWDSRWQTDSGREDWLQAEPDVVEFSSHLLTQLSQLSTKRALDLGCGVGRHAIQLAQLGFEVSGLDGSSAGLEFATKTAEEQGVAIDFIQGSMESLPYPDMTFDYVLAFNVIYHGDRPVVSRCISEIHRILKPGGFFQGTMLSKRNGNYGKGTEISANTFVDLNNGDKDHPHFYCNAEELCELLHNFELLSLIDRVHKKPNSWHWHLIAERF
ncbi:methyltransferase domain protein [Rubidibacter lacunae KORDI 51-2]|uniref:Methyltransferase domain protein n=1 Tax=Rubidibacter lacunae KORDI 51-2 TaxID=582515 RepID=U5DRZ8_9CHRO|nr:class I SAM-dependent methyltransferase [Rubidibacter lacunae]ERN42460.1 methyltransferase domain protein [Rubidibacter lacunae KORDI 51-2]